MIQTHVELCDVKGIALKSKAGKINAFQMQNISIPHHIGEESLQIRAERRLVIAILRAFKCAIVFKRANQLLRAGKCGYDEKV